MAHGSQEDDWQQGGFGCGQGSLEPEVHQGREVGCRKCPFPEAGQEALTARRGFLISGRNPRAPVTESRRRCARWACPDQAIPPARVRSKRYFNCALLVIDEVGFRPLDRIEANLFFRLVSARYERGSIVLTSNKHVRDWPAIFADDEILTTAILDRLLHHVQVLHIDGRSYRLRELGALLGPKPESPMHTPPESGGQSKN